MSRKLRDIIRLKVKGLSYGPTELEAVYIVEDGDMREEPKRVKFGETDFAKSVKEVWKSSINLIKEDESLT